MIQYNVETTKMGRLTSLVLYDDQLWWFVHLSRSISEAILSSTSLSCSTRIVAFYSLPEQWYPSRWSPQLGGTCHWRTMAPTFSHSLRRSIVAMFMAPSSRNLSRVSCTFNETQPNNGYMTQGGVQLLKYLIKLLILVPAALSAIVLVILSSILSKALGWRRGQPQT